MLSEGVAKKLAKVQKKLAKVQQHISLHRRSGKEPSEDLTAALDKKLARVRQLNARLAARTG